MSQVDQWTRAKSVGVAADLLNFSHIPEVREVLQEPSRFIILQGHAVPAPLRDLATSTLHVDSDAGLILRPVGCQYEIGRLKKQLRLNPRDSIALVDLARFYAAQGQNEHARKAVLTASALQPNHRFVIRSAARFFVHDNDPEHAFHVLSRSKRSIQDPWMLASLIAVETVLGRPPQFVKRARAMLENGDFAVRDLSELGAALSTIYVNAGEVKNAKRLFNVALQDPNDNVVAQAAWAANEFLLQINIRPEWLSDQFSSEACFYKEESAGNFEGALQAASRWFEDEPFSTRPLRGAAFAASIVRNYEYAEQSMRQALQLDPTSTECRNNLIFALTAQSKFDEAKKLLTEVIHAEVHRDEGTRLQTSE